MAAVTARRTGNGRQTDLLKQFHLSRNPFVDRTAEKTELDDVSLYIHSDLQGFKPSGGCSPRRLVCICTPCHLQPALPCVCTPSRAAAGERVPVPDAARRQLAAVSAGPRPPGSPPTSAAGAPLPP